jgi:NADH:ubiquinone oxidoreductase subunit 5 (subunit L)/multisubunit Na+/H+ antiporter MnhA subunit
MLWPILILAVPSALAGWLARGLFRQMAGPAGSEAPGAPTAGAHGAAWLFLVSTLLAAGGLALGAWLYAARGKRPGYPGGGAPAWYRALSARLWIDEAWIFLARNLGGRALARPVAWAERCLLNGAFDKAAGILRRLAFANSLLQSGQVQWYLAVALAGLFALAALSGLGYR